MSSPMLHLFRPSQAKRSFLRLVFLFLLALTVLPPCAVAGQPASSKCVNGSGTCSDTFGGSRGTDLGVYSSNWVKVAGTGSAYTTGANSAEVDPGLYAFYRYAPSISETSQITVPASSSQDAYTRDACVRMSGNVEGYCLGFAGASAGSYSNCVIEKDGQYIGNGKCGPVSATKTHTLAITASGTSAVTLAVYLDGVYTGSVVDTDHPYTVPGSGFSLQGGAADLAAWQDYQSTMKAAASTTKYGCTAGSGTCFDTFAGSSGTHLSAYNSLWTKLAGTGDAYTSGSKSVSIGKNLYAFYQFAPSHSETSLITIPPSSSPDDYTRDACVRMSAGASGYCVGFAGSYGNYYSNCVIEKAGQYIGNGSCGPVASNKTHTLALTASGTSTVTLSVYLDGVYQGSVTDKDQPYTRAGSGFALQEGVADAGMWQDYQNGQASPNIVNAGGPPSILPTAATPVFSPAPGTYTSSQSVSISSSTLFSAIYYTTDGSTPTTSSRKYSGPITVQASTTLKAIATAPLENNSSPATGVYTIAAPVAQTPVFSIPSPYSGPPTAVSIQDWTPNATIYYCQDATNTCTPNQLYTGAISFSSTEYIRALASAAGYANSPVASWQGTWTTLAISTSSCPEGTQYKTYSGCRIQATGGVAPLTYGWSTTSGNSLVEGLYLDPITGVISGTAYGQGIYAIPFTVTDATKTTVTKVINLPVRGDNTTAGCSLFPSDSIWHLNVSNLPVDTSVAAPILSAYVASSLHLVFGAYLSDGGMPFLRVPYSQQNVPVTTTMYQSYFTSGPFPSYAPVEGTQNSGADADRHTLILQTAGGGNNCRLWEMWQGAPTSTGWTDSSNAYWDLGSYDMLPQDNGSTDAAGLPILPLLYNYDEVAGQCAAGSECGVVKHPGRLTLNHTLNYHVWPATAQSGLGVCTGGYEDSNHLLSQSNPPTSCSGGSPMGEIFRLKSSTAAPAACAGHPQAQVLITAMRNYGLIVADNGITGGIVATADSRWNDDDLACLTNLKLSDFEPVNVSSKMIDLNSSQVRP